MTTLRQRRLIVSHSANGLYSYRLTSAGRAYLLDAFPERCTPYLVPPSTPKSEYRRRLRNYRVCETFLSVEAAGVEIFPDLKPKLLAPVTPWQPHSAVFYGAKEVRACNPEAAKIKNARFTGLLRAPLGTWLTYNTGDGPMKWEPKSEQRSKAFVSQLVSSTGALLRLEDVGGLMLGRDMGVGYQLLSSDGGAKRAYFRVDNTFQHFSYLPLDGDGTLVLKLILDPALNNQLRQILLGSRSATPTSSILEHDGYDAAGNPLLLAHDFDLRRISAFLSGLYLHELRGAVICFDFQAPALREFFGDKADIQAIDRAKFERRLLNI